MIYLSLRRGTTPRKTVNSPVQGLVQIHLNTTLSASIGIVQSKLWDKVDKWGGRIIMHFFLFLGEEQGNILHTLGHKVHNFMGLSTAKH